MASARAILRHAVLWTALGLPLSALAEFYCCTNPANGTRVCGDTMPEVCRGRSHKVLSREGNLLREVGPPLTPEQKAAAQVEAQQKEEQEARRLEQKRRDSALLQTYGSPEDIDFVQKRAENEVTGSMAAVTARLDELRKQLARQQAEAGTRERSSLPPEQQRALRNSEQDIKTQESVLEQKRQDLAKIRARYEADRKRYNELTGRAAPAASPADHRPH